MFIQQIFINYFGYEKHCSGSWFVCQDYTYVSSFNPLNHYYMMFYYPSITNEEIEDPRDLIDFPYYYLLCV